MNNLLIFFALPIATIIISIALQKLIKCPPLVSAVIFSIFLIVTFVINNLNFLVAAIIYAIISFVTAVIVCAICKISDRLDINNNNCRCRRNNQCSSEQETIALNNNDILAIDSNYQTTGNNGVFTMNASGNNVNNNCCCNNCNTNSTSNALSARINVIPNSNTNGRTGCLCGNYRRR